MILFLETFQTARRASQKYHFLKETACLGYTCRKGLKPESPNQEPRLSFFAGWCDVNSMYVLQFLAGFLVFPPGARSFLSLCSLWWSWSSRPEQMEMLEYVGMVKDSEFKKGPQGATTGEQGPEQGPIRVKSDEWQDLTDNTYWVYCHALQRGGWSSQSRIDLNGSGNGPFFAYFARILYAMMHRSWGVSLRQRPATEDYAAGALRREGRNSWWFTLIYIESWFASFWKFWILPFFVVVSSPTGYTEQKTPWSNEDQDDRFKKGSESWPELLKAPGWRLGRGSALAPLKPLEPGFLPKNARPYRGGGFQQGNACHVAWPLDWRIEVDSNWHGILIIDLDMKISYAKTWHFKEFMKVDDHSFQPQVNSCSTASWGLVPQPR